MVKFIFSALPFLIISTAFSQTNAQQDATTTFEFEIEKIILGDINQDRVVDTAYVKKPKFLNEDDDWGDCKNGGCKVSVSFSCNLSTIKLENAVSAGVEAIGDIDKDGIAEIIVVPGWIIGCWGQYRFFSFKQNGWKEIGRARRNLCREKSYTESIKKIRGKKLQVIEEVWVDGDVVELSKIIWVK